MDSPEEQVAFDDGRDYVVNDLREWVRKKRLQCVTLRLRERRIRRNLLTELEAQLKSSRS